MKNDYYSLLTSATTMEEAKKIATSLVEKRFVSGLQVANGAPCFYWWNGEVIERTYFTITGFTIDKNRDKIVDEIKSIHSDEVPTITFTKIDESYPEFLGWVRDITAR